MTDVTNTVQTNFIANTAQYASAVSAMSMQASGLGQVLQSVQGMAQTAGAVMGGYLSVQAMKGLAQVHSSFEDTKISMAGFLSSLHLSTNFTEGLKDAADVQQAITVAAARLPGEAEDYVAIFKQGLPEIQGAIKGSLKDLYTFSNQYAAITSSLQIDSAQAGRDLKLLLAAGTGHAGGHVKTWQQLQPFITAIPKYADITTQKFNQMDQTARGALLKEVLMGKELAEMVTIMGDTWSAQTGALASNSRSLLRQATTPIFEAMKTSLGWVNAQMFDIEGNLQGVGKVIVYLGNRVSENLVGGLTRGFAVAQRLGAVLGAAGEALARSPGFGRIEAMFDEFATGGDKLARLGTGQSLGAAGGGLQFLGPLGGILDGLSRKDVSRESGGFAANALLSLTRVIEPLLGLFATMQGVIGDFVEWMMPAMSFLFDAVVGPMTTFAVGIITLAGVMLDQLRPALDGLFKAVAEVTVGAGEFLHPALRLLGAAALWVAKSFMGQLVEGLKAFVNTLAAIISWVGKLVGKDMGNSLDKFADRVLGPETDDGAGGSVLDNIKKALEAGNKAAAARDNAANASHRATPHARGKTVQDFRGSRFDITQKFAEGFDPDRVAVAFARDVERIGEQKLQSGFEPAMGVR